VNRSAGTDRIEVIQALRGIAALAVVLFHARIWIDGPVFNNAGRLFKNGAAGVDLFFIVSGFIMVHSTWDVRGGGRDAIRFLAKRTARIWPVYVVTTIVFVAATGTLLAWFTTEAGLVGMGKALVFYPINPTAPPFFDSTPNEVGWTLNYEMWFYVLFAASLLFGKRRWWALAALFGVFLVAIPFVLGSKPPSLHAYTNYGMSCGLLNLAASPLVWEFLAGVGIGLLYRSEIRIRSRWLLATLAMSSVALVLLQQLSRVWSRHGLTGWGPALILMALLLVLWNRESPLRVPRWLLWLGDVSFSLYLVHRIPQLVLGRVIPPDHPTLVGGISFVIITTALALVLAQLSYRYLERGLAESFRRWLVRS
jgi:exopolysaccharide production protein ExoZ